MDITERKQAEEALRTSDRHWQTTFNAIADGVALLSADDHVIKCNAAMERPVGKSADQMLRRRCFEVVHGTSEPIPGYPLALARQTKRRASMELPIGNRFYDVTVDPLLDALGEYQGAVYVLVDITERMRLESESQMMEAQLRQQQKLESIGTLAGGVAHEINNPINGIMNYTQLIQDRLPAGSPLTEFTGEILHETNRVAAIVHNLLTFARDALNERYPGSSPDKILKLSAH
jgi:PAS domain S-box-containing protein